jgi:hypothetical protein
MGYSDDDQEVAAAEIMWGKEPLTMNQCWIKQTKGTYDFDVTKADKAESNCLRGIPCFGLME